MVKKKKKSNLASFVVEDNSFKTKFLLIKREDGMRLI